jgi:hypothetical protein
MATATSNRTSTALRGQRVRFGNLPTPPERIEVPYARDRVEIKGSTEAEETMFVVNRPEFDQVIGTICRRLDAARNGTRGPKPSYSAWQCEVVLLYQRICGLRSYKEARDRLTGDRAADARRLFGLSKPHPGARKQKLRAGIPSESTISRHLKRFGERRRMGAHERLGKALVAAHLQNPEMREEARTTAMDGSKLETHFQCPRVDPATGEVVNAEEVTCWDGGFVGRSGGDAKSGNGFNSVSLVTLTGLPLASRITPLQQSEKTTAEALFDLEVRRDVAPHLDQDSVHVVIADGGFNSQLVRRRIQEVGFVEQIHGVSHASVERSTRNARIQNERVIEIEGYANWFCNGHRELSCKCGQGKTTKRISRRAGTVTVRTEGECSTCGSITITPGLWRYGHASNNEKKLVRLQPGEEGTADWSFGNPLTFNDRVAAVYGRKRFAHNEGFHGQLTQRFQLYKGKRWFRRASQARTDQAIVFSIIHAIAMEQRDRAALAPPG